MDQYCIQGKPIRDNTHTSKQKEATRFLKDRESWAVMEQPILPKVPRICVEELIDSPAFTGGDLPLS